MVLLGLITFGLIATLIIEISGIKLMQKEETQASTLLQKFRHTLNEKVVQHSGGPKKIPDALLKAEEYKDNLLPKWQDFLKAYVLFEIGSKETEAVYATTTKKCSL